jgi:hypothetical protein
MNDVAMVAGATETLEPDGYLQPSRVRVTFECRKCGKQFSRVYKCVPAKDPKCPNKHCAEESRLAQLERENENLRRMLESGHAPAQIGKNVTVKAVDATAEIVMQDYGLTDLKDNVREGETVAPKLPGRQQQMADAYFSPAKAGRMAGLRTRQAELMKHAAISGAYRGMAVPPSAIDPKGRPGQSALVSVGTRPNDFYTGQRR